MPETIVARAFDGQTVPGLFAPLRLDVNGADMSRIGDGLMPFLASHDADRPLGRVVDFDRDGDAVYMEIAASSTSRSEPFLEEIRARIRNGVSIGWLDQSCRDGRRRRTGYKAIPSV